MIGYHVLFIPQYSSNTVRYTSRTDHQLSLLLGVGPELMDTATQLKPTSLDAGTRNLLESSPV